LGVNDTVRAENWRKALSTASPSLFSNSRLRLQTLETLPKGASQKAQGEAHLSAVPRFFFATM
jgi:hypothetical protein